MLTFTPPPAPDAVDRLIAARTYPAPSMFGGSPSRTACLAVAAWWADLAAVYAAQGSADAFQDSRLAVKRAEQWLELSR